jgi:hypothetical protein
MVHIWMTDPPMNFLAPNSPSFQRLPPTVQQLLLHASANRVYACEPVPPGTPATQLLTNNLREYTYPDTVPFAEKAIRWYRELLLHPEKANDMTGFDNGILIAYGMCPPACYRNCIRWLRNTSQPTLCAGQQRKFGGRTHTKSCTRPQLIGKPTRWKHFLFSYLLFSFSYFTT